MNAEHKRILENERNTLSKVNLDRIKPFLIEYKIFNRYMWKDIRTTEDMLNALPHRGPKAFQNIIEILRKAKYHEEADLLEGNTLLKKKDNSLYYVMTSTPLGFCLIINNVEFDESKSNNSSRLEDRDGSDVDAASLQDFFIKIGFNVSVVRNKKASEMIACLKDFSRQDFANVDSLVIIILSHGSQKKNKDIIYGTDGNYIYKSEICDIFNNQSCQQLQNKPKVFFFICCRGKSLDYGVVKCLPNESIDSSEVMIPSLSDMFVVHSTLPLHVSLRDEKGSYFCQELIKVLKEKFDKHELETIIKLVNLNLQKRISRLYRNIQIAHVEALGGTKKFMFCKTLL